MIQFPLAGYINPVLLCLQIQLKRIYSHLCPHPGKFTFPWKGFSIQIISLLWFRPTLLQNPRAETFLSSSQAAVSACGGKQDRTGLQD